MLLIYFLSRHHSPSRTFASWILFLLLHIIDAFDERNVPFHYCGTMAEVCRFCGARYWKLELISKHKLNRCCNQGTIQLPKLTPPPSLSQELLIGHTQRSKILLKKSRAFNAKKSFGSVFMTSHDFYQLSIRQPRRTTLQ